MSRDERYEELERRVADLTERVYRLEHRSRSFLRGKPPVKTSSGQSPVSADASLETRIGGHWLNRLGIIAILFGAVYFLKYAFDSRWIGPAGHVLIGLAGGGAVVLWSEYVRRSGYVVFSYSLKATGIGILYLSLWASSQLYDLVPNSFVFLAMSAVTAATVALALAQNAAVIAAFAMVGAYLTPAALSTGENNAVVLFTYMSMLLAGVLVLMGHRPWNHLLLGSYSGTLILYVSWHFRHYAADQFWIALGFATLFYAGFASVPWIVRSGSAASPVVLLTLMNAGTYFLQVYELLDHRGSHTAAAWAALGLGCVYFIMAYRLPDAPEVTGKTHGAIGAGLLIAAVPIAFESHWITIAWFAEAGALVWVGERTRNRFLKILGAAALALGVVRLLVVDNFEVTRLVFNHRMATFAVAILVMGLIVRAAAVPRAVYERRALPVLIIAINLLALFALNQEIADAYRRQIEQAGGEMGAAAVIVRDFAYSALWIVYGAGLMAAGFWRQSRFLRWQALILMAITVVKVFAYDTSSLDSGYRILSLIALGLVLLATSFLYQRDWFKVERHS